MKLSLFLQDSYITCPNIYRKRLPQVPYLCTALHRIENAPPRFMQRHADSSLLVRPDLRLFCLLITLADPTSPVSLRLIQ